MNRVKKVINFFTLLGIFVVPFNFAFSASTNHRYTGQELDQETDLYYYGQRYYNPDTGRFTQKDPVLKDGSIDVNFLNKETKEEMNEFLSNPQRLNDYSYVLNNPVKYTDPTGESEVLAWLLNPNLTAKQVAGWRNVANVLNLQNNTISANMLNRSLNLRIGHNLDMNISKGNDQYNIISTIQQSQDYKDYVKKVIGRVERTGKNSFDLAFYGADDKDKIGSITFNEGDLATSIHGTHYTHINGVKQKNGEWAITTNIFDVYDYELKDYQGNKILKAGNNLATVSQDLGAISNYNVNITFNDQINPRN